MTEPTVSVDYMITTAKARYTISEAKLELANLEAALADIEKRQAILKDAEELDSGG